MSLDVAPSLPSASTISATATTGIHVIKLSGYSHAKLLLENQGLPQRKKRALQETPPLPSASTIAITASAGCHVVKVSGYSQTKLLPGNGEYIKSAEFKEAGHRWCIRCYPDGDRDETAGHVSLFLELAGRSTEVHAEYQFSLVPHGQLTTAPHGGRTGTDRRTFGSRYTDNRFGFSEFVAREDLERSEYLKDDCFYIRCDIIAMNKPVVKLHDPETLDLLCYCTDDLCENIHARNK
uniref:MATH domain-containing protein n=1 Tax=Setaria italica TaxID=4555 RepID=K3ZCI1_SETIT